MTIKADPYITISRAAITLALVAGSIFSVYLAYLLFIKGVGQGTDELQVDIWGLSISPGSIGTAFLAIAIVFIFASVKTKPVFSYKTQETPPEQTKKRGGGGGGVGPGRQTSVAMGPVKDV